MKIISLCVGVIASLPVGVDRASATPITTPFLVTATTGPLAGVASAGSFTFDSTIIPIGGGRVVDTGLFTDLSFVWDGISFDALLANTAVLTFDATGSLTQALFGTDCFPVPVVSGPPTGGCGVSAGFNNWLISAGPTSGVFDYGSSAQVGIFFGTVALLPQRVSEPASGLLLGIGLAGGLLGLFCGTRRTPRSRAALR